MSSNDWLVCIAEKLAPRNISECKTDDKSYYVARSFSAASLPQRHKDSGHTLVDWVYKPELSITRGSLDGLSSFVFVDATRD